MTRFARHQQRGSSDFWHRPDMSSLRRCISPAWWRISSGTVSHEPRPCADSCTPPSRSFRGFCPISPAPPSPSLFGCTHGHGRPIERYWFGSDRRYHASALERRNDPRESSSSFRREPFVTSSSGTLHRAGIPIVVLPEDAHAREQPPPTSRSGLMWRPLLFPSSV